MPISKKYVKTENNNKKHNILKSKKPVQGRKFFAIASWYINQHNENII